MEVAVPRTRWLPEWIESTLDIKAGRDPLGLQTITQDQAMPMSVPGLLALSRRARYFSFYAFLLREYRERQLPPTNQRLSEFMKRRELDLAVAVMLCESGCRNLRSSAVGTRRATTIANSEQDPVARAESVDSFLGGYGLYYRTPLSDLSVVARADSVYGDRPLHVDVIASDIGDDLARCYKEAIQETDYYRRYFFSNEPIPVSVLKQYATKACLCRLPDYPHETAAIRNVILKDDGSSAAAQRRQSFAMFLRLLEGQPKAAVNVAAFREALWDASEAISGGQPSARRILTQWSALTAREYLQEALAILWNQTCLEGGRLQPRLGFAPDGLGLLYEQLVTSKPFRLPDGSEQILTAQTPTAELRNICSSLASHSLERLRLWAETEAHSVAAVVLALELLRRTDGLDSRREWGEIARFGTAAQPGLLRTLVGLRTHLDSHPTILQTVSWLVGRLVIQAHESVAYSKYPEFTFRFRWVDGRLVFHSQSVLSPEKFELADARHDSMSTLTRDLGYWHEADTGGQLTQAGRQLVAEAFGPA